MTKPSEQTINALIQKDLSYMKVDIADIKQAIKDQHELFAVKSDLALTNKQVEVNRKNIETQQKFIWMAIGGLTLLSFVVPYVLEKFIK